MSLQERVFGLETEYGVNFYPAREKKAPTTRIIVQTLQEVLFKDYGLPDSEFMVLGGKFHYDLGHAEWAGPECRHAREAALYDKVADYLLAQAVPRAQQLLARKGYEGQLFMAKNNVDPTGNTYGCHENYMMLRNTDLLAGDHFLRYLVRCLVPFLVSRQILAGSGRLIQTGGRQPLTFEISQRASFIDTVVSKETTRERPIVNVGREGEALAAGNYRRLHLILGDANFSGWATWIKLGTTGIVLRMIEDLFIHTMPVLRNPVGALHAVALDLTCSRRLPLQDGRAMSSLDMQWYYYELANQYLNEFECSEEEAELMEEWESALNDLKQDPLLLGDRVDWVLKKHFFESYLQQEGSSWESLAANRTLVDDLLLRDLRYHDLNRVQIDSLFTDAEIQQASGTPPAYTRARIRGTIIQQARQHKHQVTVERWQDVVVDGQKVWLPDPLAFDNDILEDTFKREWWVRSLNHEDPLVRMRSVKLLTWRKQPDALALLMSKAQQHDETRVVRCAAIDALGYRADKAAKDILLGCLNDPEVLVRWAAEEALSKIIRGFVTPPPIIAPPENDGDSYARIAF